MKKEAPSESPSSAATNEPTIISACCVFNNGCAEGDFCNQSKSVCETECKPGQWVVRPKTSSAPSSVPSSTISYKPSTKSGCCSFDHGKSCRPSFYCNTNKRAFERDCSPGRWVIDVNEPSPSPSLGYCCSFDDGESCGGGSYCNISKVKCESRCDGEWVMKILPTSHPLPIPSMIPTLTPSCCSFDGKGCGGGYFCGMSKSNCEVFCFPGIWIIEKGTDPVPSIKPSTVYSYKPSTTPFAAPTIVPLSKPSVLQSENPSKNPLAAPTLVPSSKPSVLQSENPSNNPYAAPTLVPSSKPSALQSENPSHNPFTTTTLVPSAKPSIIEFDDYPNTTPIKSPSNINSSTPNTLPVPFLTHSCCSFDSGVSCGGGTYCNRNKSNCEEECFPGQWVAKVFPSYTPSMAPVSSRLSPSYSPSMTPVSPLLSCCSFNNGESCAIGKYCNTSQDKCEDDCAPGIWITKEPYIRCCSFDGNICGGGDYCNLSKTVCESSCSPGKWIVSKPEITIIPPPSKSSVHPTTNPSLSSTVSSCCKFLHDGYKKCGKGVWYNIGKVNCEGLCAGKWIVDDSSKTAAPTLSSSSIASIISSSPSTTSSFCCTFSWNDFETCGKGAWCNRSQTNCEGSCHGKWGVGKKSLKADQDISVSSPVIIKPPAPPAALPPLKPSKSTTPCCTFSSDNFKSCTKAGWCNRGKANCEGVCQGIWS